MRPIASSALATTVPPCGACHCLRRDSAGFFHPLGGRGDMLGNLGQRLGGLIQRGGLAFGSFRQFAEPEAISLLALIDAGSIGNGRQGFAQLTDGFVESFRSSSNSGAKRVSRLTESHRGQPLQAAREAGGCKSATARRHRLRPFPGPPAGLPRRSGGVLPPPFSSRLLAARRRGRHRASGQRADLVLAPGHPVVTARSPAARRLVSAARRRSAEGSSGAEDRK